ncbi:MAG: MFS transporter [Candidatus Thorarchaeota archaeon]|nr:MFS transporter [Candidatus Thorarchaeota archaeon]
MEVSKRFFGLEDANYNIVKLARIMSILMPLFSLTVMISTTFFMIFVAEAVGQGNYIQGLGVVGTLVVVQMVVQTLLDYPTGAIGDWLGQRFIIASAFVTYAISYFMVASVTSTTPLLYLVLIYALQGFANSQQSGALGAWFDNNYRVAVPSDFDRTQYGVFQARLGMIFQIVATLSLIPGGILAGIFGRTWVFQLQGILCIVISVVAFKVIRDLPEVQEEKRGETRPTIGEYTSLLKGGVSYLFREPWVKYVITGSMLAGSTVMVWGNLILFPLYFSYLFTDIAVASYRTLLFVPGVVTGERSGVWSKRFEPKKWIPRFRILQSGGFLFFIIFAAIMFFFPPPTSLVPSIELVIPFTSITFIQFPMESMIPVILIAITFTLTMFSSSCADILTQREMLDVIPNKIRNSMYSLQPTLMMLFAIPQIGIFGWLIPSIGFPLTLVIVGIVNILGVGIIKKGLDQPKPAERVAITQLQDDGMGIEATIDE